MLSWDFLNFVVSIIQLWAVVGWVKVTHNLEKEVENLAPQ